MTWMLRKSPLGEEEVRTALAARGVSPTPQRIAIARYVLTCETHPTAEEIFFRVRETLAGVSQATVYNTLNRLVDAGLLQTVQRSGERVRYDGNTDHHHHFLDEDTGEIHDIDPRALHVHLDDALAHALNVRRVRVTLEGRRAPVPGAPADQRHDEPST